MKVSNLEISDKCVQCGSCLASGCDFLTSDCNGDIEVALGTILYEDSEEFMNLRNVCPVNAFVLDKTLDDKKIICALLQKLKNIKGCPHIKREEVPFEITADNIGIPLSRGASAYIYSSEGSALNAAEDEFYRNMFEGKDKFILKVITQYRSRFIGPYYAKELINGSIFAFFNGEVEKILHALRGVIGNEYLSDDFETFSIYPDNSTEWKMLVKGELMSDEMVTYILADFDYSVRDYSHLWNIDYCDRPNGKDFWGNYKFETKYCYKNIRDAYRELAKDLVTCCNRSKSYVEDRACEVINWLVDDYNKLLMPLLEEKIKIIENIIEKKYGFIDGETGYLESSELNTAVLEFKRRYTEKIEKELEKANKVPEPQINISLMNVNEYKIVPDRKLFMKNGGIYFRNDENWIKLLDLDASISSVRGGSVLYNDGKIFCLQNFGQEEYALVEIDIESETNRIICKLDNKQDRNFCSIYHYTLMKIINNKICIINYEGSSESGSQKAFHIIFVDKETGEIEQHEMGAARDIPINEYHLSLGISPNLDKVYYIDSPHNHPDIYELEISSKKIKAVFRRSDYLSEVAANKNILYNSSNKLDGAVEGFVLPGKGNSHFGSLIYFYDIQKERLITWKVESGHVRGTFFYNGYIYVITSKAGDYGGTEQNVWDICKYNPETEEKVELGTYDFNNGDKNFVQPLGAISVNNEFIYVYYSQLCGHIDMPDIIIDTNKRTITKMKKIN